MGSLAATMLTLKSEAFSGTSFTKKDELYYLNITMTPEEFASYANGSVNGNVEYEVVFKSDGNVVAIAMYSEYLASGGTVVKTEKMYDFLRLGSSGDIKLPEVECLDMRAIENIDCLTESAVATDYILLDVKDRGKILIKLFENIAPESVANFKKLVGEGFYDGTVFHRIIEGFMIQGGGFTVDMEYKESQSVKGEFYANGFDNKLSHNRGIVSMARAASYNSGAAQFFIMQAARPSLNGNYAAFGCVIYGMDVVDKIAAVETDNSDKPIENIVINSAKFVTLP
jgi:peptidyl-prolyl cis-trans isomerase B (cyclophilin B)